MFFLIQFKTKGKNTQSFLGVEKRKRKKAEKKFNLALALIIGRIFQRQSEREFSIFHLERNLIFLLFRFRFGSGGRTEKFVCFGGERAWRGFEMKMKGLISSLISSHFVFGSWR